MITIFSIPKSFENEHIKVIQKNAIKSWTYLSPKPEIILFGNDNGVSEISKELGILNIPDIKKNDFGTPLLNSAFDLVQKIAKNDILVYINADIILFPDFITKVRMINIPVFLMSGRRWDLDIDELIDFSNVNWENNLRNKVNKEGRLHSFSGMDYFVFPRNLPYKFPPFVVGRPGWDNWFVYKSHSVDIPVIDATKAIKVVHQNHNYFHIIGGKRDKNTEAKKNLKLIKDFSKMMTMRNADLVLTEKGISKLPFLRKVLNILFFSYPGKMLISFKRRMQKCL